MRDTIDEMEGLSFPALPDMVPLADIHSGKGLDGSEVLIANFDRLIQLCYQNWQYHFEFLNLGYLAYLDFFTYASRSSPASRPGDRPDGAGRGHGAVPARRRAQEALAAGRGARPAGRLRRHRRRRGHPVRGRGPPARRGVAGRVDRRPGPVVQLHRRQRVLRSRQVLERAPGHPLGYVADYIRRVEDGQEIMRPVDALVAEKDRIVEEYRELLDGDELATFDAKRGLAATAYPYVENHNFLHRALDDGRLLAQDRELSDLFVQAGSGRRTPTCLPGPRGRSARRCST